MSLGNVKTIAFIGINAIEIEVQAHIGPGLPCFAIVGLPDKSIGEAKERIRAVFNTIGLSLPPKRVTINMSPASIQKEGSHYDLPIALSILSAMKIINQQDIENWLVLGELSLDGTIQEVNGILIAAIHANSNNLKLICPYRNSQEGGVVCENLIPINSILEIISFLKQGKAIPINFEAIKVEEEKHEVDMCEVEGQELCKQALEIAAVFKMHVLLIGPPGIGKSMLVKRFPTILPPLTSKEALEVNMIYSLSSKLKFLKQNIPFREPHHSCSLTALVGGGAKALPGEITLAHNGVLFLDELGEYSKAIEGLRQSMETGEITISRNNKHITYPAKSQIIAAMNPCKCGYFNTSKECSKAPKCANEYQNKISGPILDRFDLIVYMNNSNIENKFKTSKTSKEIKEKVVKAREFYEKHFQESINKINIEKTPIKEEAKKLLIDYCKLKDINSRTYNKILKIARAIASLEQKLEININHVSNALLFKK